MLLIKKKSNLIFIMLLIGLLLNLCQIVFGDSLSASDFKTIIPVLTYHNFTLNESTSYKINIDKFDEQMEYLYHHNYSVISMSELKEGLSRGILPPKPVVITIDDGYKSTYDLAYPVLKKYHFPATLFVYTDFIEKNDYSLTWDEIREMAKNNFEIGSHTVSHCNLIKIKENETSEDYLNRIKREIFLSREILEKEIGREIDIFAYPYGTYNPQVKGLVVQAGYKIIVNANSMNNDTDANLLSLNRQIIYGQNSLDSFIHILHQRPLPVAKTYPEDGTVSMDQLTKIGAVLKEDSNTVTNFIMKLGGAKVNFDYNSENREISFTPKPQKPLIKKSYIVSITARDKDNSISGKTSWLITIK